MDKDKARNEAINEICQTEADADEISVSTDVRDAFRVGVERGFDAGYEAAAGRWVAVRFNDDVPKQSGWYLVTFNDLINYNPQDPAIMFWHESLGEWDCNPNVQEVIAWQPLPEPYRKEKQMPDNNQTREAVELLKEEFEPYSICGKCGECYFCQAVRTQIRAIRKPDTVTPLELAIAETKDKLTRWGGRLLNGREMHILVQSVEAGASTQDRASIVRDAFEELNKTVDEFGGALTYTEAMDAVLASYEEKGK